MNILPILLILAAVFLLGLAVLRTYGLVLHNRRRRRRRKAPRGLDPMTLLLYIAAAVLLLAGMLTWSGQTPDPNTDTTPESAAGTQSAFGWREENGVRTYLKEDGTRALGWLDADEQRYYFGSDGAMHTGWLELEGVRYYFKEDGTMARGQVEIGGVRCFFTSTGAQILLVNPWNPVPEGYAPDLVALDIHYGTEGMQVDRSCLEALTEMIDACNAAGSRAYVLSSYRSYETQERIYNRKVENLMAQGLSRAEAEAEAATVVVLPGTSEHHLGLAVDIIDTSLWALEEEQEDLPAQKWLMENSWRYGFILRYPKDKIEITGVIYEPWHYRYVGKELAAELCQSGLTLEEYMDSLS